MLGTLPSEQRDALRSVGDKELVRTQGRRSWRIISPISASLAPLSPIGTVTVERDSRWHCAQHRAADCRCCRIALRSSTRPRWLSMCYAAATTCNPFDGAAMCRETDTIVLFSLIGVHMKLPGNGFATHRWAVDDDWSSSVYKCEAESLRNYRPEWWFMLSVRAPLRRQMLHRNL